MAKIKLITLEQLLEMMINEENFKLVEALSEEDYKEGHLPGAISIPADHVNEKAESMLSKDDLIVTYCSGYACHASTNAAKSLMDLGFTNVLDFKAGKQGWLNAGLELEK